MDKDSKAKSRDNEEDEEGETRESVSKAATDVKTKKGGKKANKEENMDDLKKELSMDDHRISEGELFERYDTDPEQVRTCILISKNIFFPKL